MTPLSVVSKLWATMPGDCVSTFTCWITATRDCIMVIIKTNGIYAAVNPINAFSFLGSGWYEKPIR